MVMKIKYFLFGVGFTLMFLLLTGAYQVVEIEGNSAPLTLDNGRYQLSSWATSIGDKNGVIGAFVIDTVSGETKTVYSREYGPKIESTTVKNDLKKPFSSIK
jgi:hypothetical protein